MKKQNKIDSQTEMNLLCKKLGKALRKHSVNLTRKEMLTCLKDAREYVCIR